MVKSKHPRIRIRHIEHPPYTIDGAQLRRFNLKHLIFNRLLNDPNWAGYQRMIDERVPEILNENRSGYSHIDYALWKAALAIHDSFPGSFARTRIKRYRLPSGELDHHLSIQRYEVKDSAQMSIYVKRAAKLFGVSLTGICKLNRMWLYSGIDIPNEFDNVIVMAIEMDPAGIATSPAFPSSAATNVGYSNMGFVLALLGEFIRNLGYKAIQCGNDTALSVPLAIDAGLGQLGRSGLLITPKYGSRVRLCKILTDLPLTPDKPIEFGVTKTCTHCKLCAEACEVDAISKEDAPTFEGVCVSNSSGALKWHVNAERCYQFWCDNGGSCSTCITVCPYNATPFESKQISPEQFWREL